MASWSNGKRVLLFLFCFAYTVASIGVFFLRPALTGDGGPDVNSQLGQRQIVSPASHSPVMIDDISVETVRDNPVGSTGDVLPQDDGDGDFEAQTLEVGKSYLMKNSAGECLIPLNTLSPHGCPVLGFGECKADMSHSWAVTTVLLQNSNRCMDIYLDESDVHVCPCHTNNNQQWEVVGGNIRSTFSTKKCLHPKGPTVSLGPCQESDSKPEWTFEEVENTWSKPFDMAGLKMTYEGIPAEGIVKEDGQVSFGDDEAMDHVRGMMLHAWTGYRSFAWGLDELKPVSNTGRVWMGPGIAASVIDSLDTLYIMGLMDEYKEARDYVEKDLDFDRGGQISFFETVIRGLGGLLAAYGLTGDRMYVTKAQDLGDRLLHAFKSPSGLPFGSLDLKSHSSSNHRWAPGTHILAEVGTIQLEFKYLAEVSGKAEYANVVNKVMNIMEGQDSRDPGLYPVFINEHTGSSRGTQDYSLGGLGDSYYEYLLKQYLQTNRTEPRFRELFDRSSQGVKKIMVGKVPVGDETLTYVGKYKNGYLEPKMEHLTCFTGGMFALGAWARITSTIKEDLDLGAELTRTCRRSYADTPSGLGPEKFGFRERSVEPDGSANYYILRPEYVESLFYLWRTTHDQKYRKWGWDVIVALEKSSRTETGYSGLREVWSTYPEKNDVQESFFLAETLKYLYLLYTDDSVISLDKYVFNTEAHPLPVFTPTVFNFPENRGPATA